MCERGAPSWADVAGSKPCSARNPSLTVPLLRIHVARSFRYEPDPLQRSNSSQPSDPAAGLDSPEVSSPFNGILALAPYGAGRPDPLRLRSQAFSASQRFFARTSSTALFRAAAIPDRPSSLRSLPLAGIAVLSRGHWLPCGYPPASTDEPFEALSPSVSTTPTP